MTHSRRILALLTVALIAAVNPADALGEERPAADVKNSPVDDEFVIIPLRIHILSAKTLPEIDCRLSDADVARILKKINRVWHQAHIHWGLESLVREPAANLDRFNLVRELGGGGNLGLYRILFPGESHGGQVVNLYYIHEFPVNGVWLGREVVVKEAAQLKEVEGGIDEPIPRVSAHELAHCLGLEHRQNRTNLLASGTTGTLLNAAEIASAREQARTTPGAATVATVRRNAETAEAANDRTLARRLWTWLAEIPGPGADEARDRLERLNADDPAPSTREPQPK